MVYFPLPPKVFDYDYEFEDVKKKDLDYEDNNVRCEVIEGETIRVIICERGED